MRYFHFAHRSKTRCVCVCVWRVSNRCVGGGGGGWAGLFQAKPEPRDRLPPCVRAGSRHRSSSRKPPRAKGGSASQQLLRQRLCFPAGPPSKQAGRLVDGAPAKKDVVPPEGSPARGAGGQARSLEAPLHSSSANRDREGGLRKRGRPTLRPRRGSHCACSGARSSLSPLPCDGVGWKRSF